MRYYPLNHLFDDFFTDEPTGLLKTDIHEKDGMYELNIAIPGVKKEDIQIELSNGYLKVSATRKIDHDDSNSRYVRKERYEGTCSRNFYIGDGYHQEDIKASFDNGELKITLPKEVKEPETNNKMITIE